MDRIRVAIRQEIDEVRWLDMVINLALKNNILVSRFYLGVLYNGYYVFFNRWVLKPIGDASVLLTNQIKNTNMKSLIILVASMMAFTWSLDAQNIDKKGERAAQSEERMEKAKAERNEKLNLTEAQSAELDRINAEFREKMQAENKETRKARMERVKELNEMRAEEFKKVLDEEQFAQWQEMQQERQSRAKNMKARQMEKRRGGDGDLPSRKEKGPRGQN